MVDTVVPKGGAGRIVRIVARVLLIIWAASWIVFNFGSMFAESGTEMIAGLVHHGIMLVITLFLLLLCFSLELAGGLALIAFAGMFCYIVGCGDWEQKWAAHLLLELPAVITGILFIVAWAKTRYCVAPEAPPPVKPADPHAGD